MTSNAASQPLNFIPQWLRTSANAADSAAPSSSSTSSTNISKIPTTRHRYSKDEILALRTNVSALVAKEIRSEIVKNLKEVENIYRPQILDPSTLKALTEDESAEINSLSNFICGRTSGGANRPSNNNSQSQSDTRKHRDPGSFTNRTRTVDDRDHPQSARRPHGNSRHTSDDWRRSRGDEDESKDLKEEPTVPTHNSTSRGSRNGPARRGERAMDQRTKSDDKWNSNDNRSNTSHQFESNQTRGSGWRKQPTIPDRNLQPRRTQPQKDDIPEWMNDNLDGDTHPGMATFEQDGTYISSTSSQSNVEDKLPPKSNSDELLSQSNTASSQTKESIHSEKSTPPPPIDTAVLNNPPNSSKSTVSQPSPPVQKPVPVWDEDFGHHDVATTVVESTLAEDYDDSPLMSTQTKVLSMVKKPSPPAVTNIPQKPVIIDDKKWYYKDPQNTVQGPFTSNDMERWFAAGYFNVSLPVKRLNDAEFSTIQQLSEQLGRLPFRSELPSQYGRQQTTSASQKKTAIGFNNTPNNSFVDQYMVPQPAARQTVQNTLPFNNRPTSMALTASDLKRTSSQSQVLIHSPQSSSSMLPTNQLNDPAIIYSQQRSSSLSNQQVSNSNPYDDSSRSFRQLSSQSNASIYLSNASTSQQNNDIVSRLAQAAQMHTKQQQDKIDEQRRRELQHQSQQNDFDFQRLRLYSQMDQERSKRQEDELRYKHEQQNNRQMMNDTMKKPSNIEMDPFVYMQQSIQQQKEQAQIEALKAENVRRYQQHYQEVSQQSNLFQMSDGNSHWSRPTSFANDQAQSSSYIDMQDSEQERRIREAASALLAHQNPKSRAVGNPQSNSWNLPSPSYQDVHRQQQTHNDLRSQMPSAWDDPLQRSYPQSASSNYWDHQYSSSTSKQGTSNSNKSSYVPILR